ncbi:MAG: hypothetical protein WCK02_02370 [Bacteroidota bacterium]
MKTLSYLKYGILAIALFAIVACEKERIVEQEEDTEFTSLEDFYNENQPEEQSFIIDSTGNDSVVGKEGTHIWGIPNTIFMYKNTHQDITYPYVLKLIEAYSIKNMIFSKLPTVAQDSMINSDGELKVTAFKNNEELMIKENLFYQMMAPNANPDNNKDVYYGFTNGSTTDWNKNILQTDYIFTQDNTNITTIQPGYLLAISKLGWLNIAKPINPAQKTDISFTAAGVNTNLLDVFVILPNQHSFKKASNMVASNMPIGEQVKVFSMGKDTSGKMHYFCQSYTISAGLTVAITMQEATKAEVLTVMDTL